MGKCILCNANATVNVQDNASRTIYNCHNCGVFVLSDVVEKEAQQSGCQLAAYMTARKLSGNTDIILLTYDKAKRDKDYLQMTVDQLLSEFPRSFTELMDLVLVNLSHLSDYAGSEIKVEGLDMCPVFYVRKQNYDTLSFIIKSMQKFELIEVNYYGSAFFPCGVIVAPKGWDRLSRMGEEGASSNALILPPGEDNDYADAFVRMARKAVRECGYKVLERKEALETVNHDLISQIKSSQFVVCDLSRASSAAYYVAGYAQALGKTTILTCSEREMDGVAVDTAQICVLAWSDEKQLHGHIANAIRALER